MSDPDTSSSHNPFKWSALQWIYIIALAAVTAALTITIRIPIPGSGGYLNLGDMAVVFSGLFLGGVPGLIVGGVGSAAADLLGGFFVFAPVTFIAKGLEGFIAGYFGRQQKAWLVVAVLAMVTVYFVAEIFIPGMGWAAAVSELPFNLLQAAVGGVGGFAVYKSIDLARPD